MHHLSIFNTVRKSSSLASLLENSMAELWTTRTDLVHFTSALRYPVFVNGTNYSGQPSMTATPVLRHLLDTCLREEAVALSKAIWIPLGPKATQGVEWIIQ